MTVFSEPKDGPSPEIPSLDEVMTQFDAVDLNLQMSYSRYMERPSSRRMSTISDETGLLFDSFGEVLRKVTGDSSDCVGEDEQAQIVASILHDMNTKHSILLSEYSDAIVLPTDAESKDAWEHLLELLIDEAEESRSAFVDEAIGHFRGVLETDMEVIDHHASMRADSTPRLIGERALNVGMEMAKVSGGVVIGMFIFNKFHKK